jgi:hypothetical protein
MGPTTGILRRNPSPLVKDYDADMFTRSTCCSVVGRIALGGERAAFISFIHCALALRQCKASGGLAAAKVDRNSAASFRARFLSPALRVGRASS